METRWLSLRLIPDAAALSTHWVSKGEALAVGKVLTIEVLRHPKVKAAVPLINLG
jgi:hypothetical protein